MQNILIVENNPIQCETLVNAIRSEYPSWNVTVVSNYEEAVGYITHSVRDTKYTLFLLDTDIHTSSSTELGGFLLAQRIRSYSQYFQTPILFLSSDSKYCLQALSSFHCYNYLVAPCSGERILEQLSQMIRTGYLESYISLRDINKNSHKLHINDIRYVEVSNRHKIIHLADSSITTNMYTFSDLMELTDSLLIQCHKQFAVNKNYIFHINRADYTVDIDGILIPVGRKYIDDIQD